MSMTACAICGGTIDCSGKYRAVCAHCGKAVHTLCDDEYEFTKKAYVCPSCRGELQEQRIIDEQYVMKSSNEKELI